jgi:arsenate reductase
MTLPGNDDPILLLHNPRCSKSRTAKVLLEQRGIDFEVREYLEDPLDRSELEDLAARLDRPPAEWIRVKEKAYAEAGLDRASKPAAILDALREHPILLERPIVIRGGRAVVARPPSLVEELFEDG